MKKFFKDVIGELRDPSDNTEKVLDVIRRVIRVSIFITMIITTVNPIIQMIGISTVYDPIKLYFEGIIQNCGLFKCICDYVDRIIDIAVNIYLFVVINKSIRKDKRVESKGFVYVLIVSALSSLIFNIIDGRKAIRIIYSFVNGMCFTGIVVCAFYKFKDNDTELENRKIARIRYISLFGYLIFAINIIKYLFYTISVIPLLMVGNFVENLGGGNLFYGILWFLQMLTSPTVFIGELLVLIFVVILRFRYTNGVKKTINILLVIFTIVGTVVWLSSGWIFTAIIFVISASYINKNKAFDDLGKRVFKNIVDAIKKGFNNYLSFKE